MGARVDDNPLAVKDTFIAVGRGNLDGFKFDKAF
jgi:hypothetical protein